MSNLNNPFAGADAASIASIKRLLADAGCTDQQIAGAMRGNQGAIKQCQKQLQASYLAGLQRVTSSSSPDAAAKLHTLGQRTANGELGRRLDAGESIDEALKKTTR